MSVRTELKDFIIQTMLKNSSYSETLSSYVNLGVILEIYDDFLIDNCEFSKVMFSSSNVLKVTTINILTIYWYFTNICLYATNYFTSFSKTLFVKAYNQ